MEKQKLSLIHLVHLKLDYREYAMGHEVSLESLSDVSEWLSEQLDSKKV